MGVTGQVLLIVLVVMGHLEFVRTYRPLWNSSMNNLETLALLVSISVSYCGMYYVTAEYYGYLTKDSPIKWLFLAIVFVSVTGYKCYWLRFVWTELLVALSTTSERAFRCLTCYRISPEDFRRLVGDGGLGPEDSCESEVCLSGVDPEEVQVEAIIDKTPR